MKLEDSYNKVAEIRDKLLNTFYPYYNVKWQACSRKKDCFIKRESKKYLNEEFVVNFQNAQDNLDIEHMEVERCNVIEPTAVNEVVMEDVSNVSRYVGPVIQS